MSDGACAGAIACLAERLDEPLHGLLCATAASREPAPLELSAAPARRLTLSAAAMSGYSASFAPDGGLHPTLHLSVPSTLAPGPSCALHALVAVPQELIADRYQFSQLERDGRLGVVGSGQAVWHRGEGDLEAPVWRAGPASVLVRLSDSSVDDEAERDSGQKGTDRRGSIEVEVPLHLRYQEPVERRWLAGGARADSRVVEVEVPWVFWACPAGALPLPTLV